MSDDDLTRLRREDLGMVYQFFNLLSTLSVRENVALPALQRSIRRPLPAPYHWACASKF